jgi:hypothetical protein
MNDAGAWEEANSEYLAAALEWLKVCLEENHHSRTSAKKAQPSGRLAAAALGLQEVARSMDPAPALVLLSRRLGLSTFEQNVLLLCAAPEFDSSFLTLFARAQADASKTYATFALALSIFEQPAWDALAPERSLRFWRLIEIHQPGTQALATSALRADERIVNFIKGLNLLDDRLTAYMTAVESTELGNDLAASQRELLKKVIAHWRQVGGQSLLAVVQLAGPDAASKQLLAVHAAAKIGRQLYRLSPEALPTQPGDLELLSRLWERESLLLPVALYVDAQEVEMLDAHTAATRRFLARSDGFSLLGVREPWPRLARDTYVVDVCKPTASEQRKAWEAVVEERDTETAAALASQFNLNLADIEQLGRTAKLNAAGDSSSLSERLWVDCCARVRPLLDALAHRLEPKATWEDIVLPEQEMDLLGQIASQVNHRSRVYEEWGFGRNMNRGLGISALFAGESGTGKTMAAEVIANELRLNLYRIDLSAVVSKYIGETEKNLRRLFDAAEDGGAILFFDEADALFGKRSEVKDSHDRYANIEINYLLQRMEAYRGLAILATNMRSAMDTAFTRRLRFIVNFPFPSFTDRKRMWQKAFPSQTPTRHLDYDRLGRLNLTGGSIHNAALHAAFLGARKGKSVTMRMALAAARAEFIKLDRPINDADFRWLESTEEVA